MSFSACFFMGPFRLGEKSLLCRQLWGDPLRCRTMKQELLDLIQQLSREGQAKAGQFQDQDLEGIYNECSVQTPGFYEGRLVAAFDKKSRDSKDDSKSAIKSVKQAHYKIETFRRVEAVRVSAYWTRVGWPSATEMAEEVTLKTKRHDLTTLEFVMSVNGVDITEETWPVLQQSYKDEINIKVTLHRPKQLSDYSEEEGRQRLAKGREIIDENLEIPSFHVEAYASIKKAGIMSARLRTFQDVINFVTLTLAVGLRGKLAAFTGKEQTRRQLIAAVLQGAILMAGIGRLEEEVAVTEKGSSGVVDWLITALHLRFPLAIVEAKTDSTGMHIGQLLASMSAAREQWLLRHQLSTRKRQMGSMESATECPVHSIGILTNAEKWIVLDFNHQTATLRTSRTYELFLPANATDESLEATVMPVLKDLAAVLLSQEEALEEWVT